MPVASRLTLSNLLVARRRDLELTQSAVAALALVSLRTVQNWETGDRLPLATHFESACVAYQLELSVLTDSISESLVRRGAA